MSEICFVIQPFDKGKFDLRYKDIIEPAIKECGLDPYRVDEDTASIIPIESIHTKIKASSICIAEITTDNPNVWYELGYAIAVEKNIIMLCSEERTSQFPFDIRHRNILLYQTQTRSDFDRFKTNLKNRINASISTRDMLVGEKELDHYERKVLKVIWNNQNTPFELTSKDTIVRYSMNNEYVINALRKLISKKLIEYVYSSENGMVKSFYRLTSVGEEWIHNNQNSLYEEIYYG